ncbi:MAG: Outer membrane protein assembly factor BamA [Chlamydiae bacterium]|nr:Outer membrane protein assembly factor BamA [Chlamydiota bacterium]
MNKLLLLLVLFVCSPLLLGAQEYESMRVAQVEIEVENLPSGSAFTPNSVRARMQTKVGGYFSQNEFDADLKNLAEEYDRVDPSMEIINDEIFLTLKIWLKPTVSEIVFYGNEHVRTRKLLRTLDIPPGSLFERETFIEKFHKLRLFYFKKGYFEAELDYEIIVLEDNQIQIQVNIFEGRAGKIGDIVFSGVTPPEEDEILDIMLSRRYNFLLSWYTGRGTYHPEMLEHDRLQILNYVQDLGYADATVDICLKEAPKKNKILLVVTIDKGTYYTVGNVRLNGNTLYTTQEIWDLFAFGCGSRYSPELIRATIQNLTNLYGRQGYIEAQVDMGLSLQDDCPVYDVDVTIEEGEQYYVGLVKVFGNRVTQSRVILHENLLCPGEVFNIRRLQGTEARLANTGYFAAVNVYAVQSQLEDPEGIRQYRDVYIEVEETSTGNLGIFGGMSSLDSLFAGVELTERNFRLAGIPELFSKGPGAIRGGGEFANLKTNIGKNQTSYVFQWTKPYFLDTPWVVGGELEKANNRALSRAYDVKTYGGSIHATYLLNAYLKFDIHYRTRYTNTHINDKKKNANLEKLGKNDGLVSAAGVSLIYDSTDNPRRASCGLRSRLLYELAGLGGRFKFMKFAYLNSYYYPFSKKGTFKLRGDLQFTKTYGSTGRADLPLSEYYFMGGETTVRGYKPFSIGPKTGNEQPIGGLSSLLLSQEYQHNLLKVPCIDAFAFVDAGYLTRSELTIGRYAASFGFGIRMQIMPNMPLMMGLGWPIHPDQKMVVKDEDRVIDNKQTFFFAFGGTF